MADISSKEGRNLPFPLKDPASQHGNTPNDGIPHDFNWQAVDDDEQVEITLKLSLNEYLALATAVDVGRDIAFGEDSQWIWWIWTRAFRLTPETGQCVEYPPSASFIQFAPSPYPFTGDIPSGYLQPPFFVFSEILPSLIPDFIEDWLIDASGWSGYEPTDVLTAAWAFPFLANWFNDLANGLPRFTVNVTGVGTVELHLLSVPIGGRAVVSIDVEANPIDILNGIISGNIFIVETERDLSSAPPETYPVNIVEVELPDDGEHFIHVTFLPSIDPDFVPIQFGGGLRKVVLCGVEPIGEVIQQPCEVEMNDTARYIRTGALGLAANTWTFIAWLNASDDVTSWEAGNIGLVVDNMERVQWQGEGTARFHVSAGMRLGTNSAATHGLRIVHSSGIVLETVFENTATVSQLNIDTDVTLEPDEYVYVQAFTGVNGSLNFTDNNPHIAIHNITNLGAQGLTGQSGITGDSGAIPPSFEYVFINNMRTATDAWLDDIATPFDGSPQSIDPDIPAGNPTTEQELFLCKAIATWVNLYCENKLAQVRGASDIHQAFDALLDAIQDALGVLDNVLGWSIGSDIFGCFVDLSSARVALEDVNARNDVTCCLYDELKDVALATGSFAGAIAACLASLTDEPHDILCMMDSDLSEGHEVLFYYLYGRSLEGNVATLCPCVSEWSYIEYDFTVSNHGFTATNGTYVNGVGWEGVEIDPDPDGISRQDLTITKVFTGALPKTHAMGYNIDAHTDCGLSSQSIALKDGVVDVWGASIGNLSNGDDQFRTFTNGTSVPPNPLEGDTIVFRFAGSACGGVPTALMRVKKVRLWLAQDSDLTGTPSAITPQGLGANGSTSDIYWQ